MSLQNRHFRVEYANGFDAKIRVLTSGRDFRFDFDPPSRYFTGRYFIGDLPPRFARFPPIREAIFVVDRHVRRRRGPTGSWSRSLNLGIELLEPTFWSSNEVLDALQQTVEFLTGDDWDFVFFQGPARYEWSPPLLSNVFAGEFAADLSLQRGAGLGYGRGKAARRKPGSIRHPSHRIALSLVSLNWLGSNSRISKPALGQGSSPYTVHPYMPHPDSA